MKTRLIFTIILLCSTFIAMGQFRIILTEQNKEVCPTREGGYPRHYDYSATNPTNCNFLKWEFTRTVYDHEPHVPM